MWRLNYCVFGACVCGGWRGGTLSVAPKPSYAAWFANKARYRIMSCTSYWHTHLSGRSNAELCFMAQQQLDHIGQALLGSPVQRRCSILWGGLRTCSNEASKGISTKQRLVPNLKCSEPRQRRTLLASAALKARIAPHYPGFPRRARKCQKTKLDREMYLGLCVDVYLFIA